MMTREYIPKKMDYSTDSEDNSDSECTRSVNSVDMGKKRLLKDSKDHYNENSRRKLNCKSFSKNALNARANRLKKKRYIESLEKELSKLRDENTKLNSIVGNQSYVIEDLRKEVKYVKNILANNSEITKLLKAINGTTGMPVTSSLNKNLTILSDFALKNNSSCKSNSSDSMPTNYLDMPTGDLFENEDIFLRATNCDTLFSNYDIPMNSNSLLDENGHNSEEALKEHNYTISSENSSNEDAGICLHVSNGKFSLEFCLTCQENAAQTWKEVESTP